MRFCFITTFFPPLHFGGDAVFVASLANALVRRGHHVEVVHCADSFQVLRGSESLSEFPLEPGIRVHTLRSSFGGLSPALTYLTGEPVLKHTAITKILKPGFDVVHWHNFSLIGCPGDLPSPGAVHLCTLHDYWLICPTHILFKYKQRPCDKPNCIRCSLSYGRIPQFWRAGGRLARKLARIDRFLAPSQYVIDRIQRSLDVPITKLPHFVPAPPAVTGERARSYYLVVGRLIKAKGVQTILPLFRRTGRRLLIVGDGGYAPGLRRLATGAQNIQFLGKLPYDRVQNLYAEAIATLVPSICEETFGLTILESWRHRTPAVASSVGALQELIAETGGGVCHRGADELESILDRLENESSWAERMGERGHARLHQFSEETHLRGYFDILAELSEASRRPPRTGRPVEDPIRRAANL